MNPHHPSSQRSHAAQGTYLLRVLRAVKRDALCVFAVAPCTAALLHEVREGLDTSTATGDVVDPFISVVNIGRTIHG